MKNVLITGGSRGIGAELVEAFAKQGYGVYFFYKSSESKARELSERTGATGIRCDVSKEEDVKKAFEELHKGCYKIDILVNNAGIGQIKPFMDISAEDWQNMMGVTLDGAFFCTKAAVSDMLREKWGRIINISSMWGQTGASCEVHYSAAKAGVIGFTKALAKELGPSGITVNCIAPGFIDTDMNKGLNEEDVSAIIEEIPLGRVGLGGDIAGLALFLSSNEASYITGQTVGINGGMVMN